MLVHREFCAVPRAGSALVSCHFSLSANKRHSSPCCLLPSPAPWAALGQWGQAGLPLVGNSIQACAALEAGDLWVTLGSDMGPTVTAQDVPCI